MGNKDPTPRADALRAQREERYGHLQATTDKPAGYIKGADAPTAPARKLIPYAGMPKGGQAGKFQQPVEQTAEAKQARKRVKRKRRTELPPEGEKP